MRTRSFICLDVDLLGHQLQKCLNEGLKPTLAIVFASPKQDLQKLVTIFSDADIDLAGCTTAGEIINDEMYESSIAVMLLEVNRDWYDLEIVDYKTETVYQASFQAGLNINKHRTHPGLLVLSGGMAIDAEALIHGLRDGLGRDLPMFGGLAADELKMEQTFAFSNNFITDKGSVLVIFDTQKIKMEGLAISGWEAVGGVNEITRSEGNVVYSINGEPAYDVFIRYFGLSEKSTKSDLLINIQTNYPFQFQRNGKFILRSPLQVDEVAKTITLAARVEEGARFRFSNSPGFEVIDQTVREFAQLKETAPDADALILFSCKGRHGALGPMLEDEIKSLYDYWKKPMIGFLSYGEIGDGGDGICAFHNETCSLVILKEI